MESTLTADKVNYDRRTVVLTKNLNRCVDLLDVNEAASADLKKSKRIMIQVAGQIIVHACHQVRPMCPGHVFLRQGHEVENIQCIAAGGDRRARCWGLSSNCPRQKE